MATEQQNTWCILRTAGRNTMPLTASLARDGFDVWTPIETRIVRVPRMNIRREVRQPIMPSYVFANSSHLVDLLELAEPSHADFSVLHWMDRIPLIADSDLTALRRIEAKRTPLKKADRTFPLNSRVRVKEGSFGGMSGDVERSDRSHTVVCFAGRYAVKISTFLLDEDSAYKFQPATGLAALAA